MTNNALRVIMEPEKEIYLSKRAEEKNEIIEKDQEIANNFQIPEMFFFCTSSLFVIDQEKAA